MCHKDPDGLTVHQIVDMMAVLSLCLISSVLTDTNCGQNYINSLFHLKNEIITLLPGPAIIIKKTINSLKKLCTIFPRCV